MLHSLNTAQTGLSTSKVQVENVMNNIANENTDGYKTRNVNTEEAKQIDNRMSGRGSAVIDVTRVTDMYMYENILQEDAKAASYDQLNTMLDELEGIFKETDESGLSVDLDKFFTSMENLRLNPQNEIYRNDFINNGNILVDSIKTLYSQVESFEVEIKNKLDDHTSEVNNILSQIGSLNDEMRQKNHATNDLLDKRDALERQLTNYTDVSIINSSVEDYNLEIGGESAIKFYNNVHTMSVGEEFTAQKDVYGKFNGSNQYVSSLVENTWGQDVPVSEVQEITLSSYATYTVDLSGAATNDSGDMVKLSIGGLENYTYVSSAPQNASSIASALVDEETITIDNIDYKVSTGSNSEEIVLTARSTSVPSGNLSVAIVDDASEGGISQPATTSFSYDISGTADGNVYFLGAKVGEGLGGAADYVLGGDSLEDVVDKVVADKAAIINTWNSNHPNMQIADIIKTAADKVSITYEDSEGDLPELTATSSNGIVFSDAVEVTKGEEIDYSITYNFNNTTSFTITEGETLSNVVDSDGDGVADSDLIVTKDNIVQAMVHKINTTDGIKEHVTAYNGQYSLDTEGNKLLKANYPADIADIDHYLVVESNTQGDKGKFVADIIVSDTSAALDENKRMILDKDDTRSKVGADDVFMELFGKKIDVNQGEFAPIVDNLSTLDANNMVTKYKDMLDTFTDKFVDMFSEYIEVGQNEYVYGKEAVSIHDDAQEKVSLGLFEGSTVDTLVFNDKMTYTLQQEDLDYMTTVRWKDDINFGGDGENKTSFSQYYQSLRVTIAQDSELTIQRKENQAAVQESLNNSYDKLVKVDKDEEMVNLIKFQAAYEANAKMITVVDEMLQTILGMKR